MRLQVTTHLGIARTLDLSLSLTLVQ